MISNWIAIISILSAIVALLFMWLGWPAEYVPPKYEATGVGTIVFYNSGTRELLFEDEHGFQKMMTPVCSKQLPVWTHMRTNMMFRWAPYKKWVNGRGPDNGEECYDVLGIQRLDIGQKEHPYEIIGHFQ